MTNAYVPGLSQAISPSGTVTYFPAVNTIRIAGTSLPGKWTLLEAPKVFGWQIQQGFGLSGAHVFPIGDELILPKFKGEFWATADWQLMREIRKTLLQKSVILVQGTLTSKALGIYHPELQALGVTGVVVKAVSPLVQDEAGLWVMTLDFIQYRAPITAPPKPATVIPDAPKPAPVAVDNADKELQAGDAQIAPLLGK
jgi:hypothetical protein